MNFFAHEQNEKKSNENAQIVRNNLFNCISNMFDFG